MNRPISLALLVLIQTIMASFGVAAHAADTAVSSKADPSGCTIDRFTIHSPSMDRDIKVAIVLPPEYASNTTKAYPILYTLHGGSAPYDVYASMPPVLAALKDKPMIVACFDADNASWYLDTQLPQNWTRDNKPDDPKVKSMFTTFFFNEYIPALDQKYRINPRQRMLTGFSMGGYGAFHYMLAQPGMFCAVSGMSCSFTDYVNLPDAHFNDRFAFAWARFYGPVPPNRDKYVAIDPFQQIKDGAAKGMKLPPIMMRCGTEDPPHIAVDRQMNELLQSLHYSCDYKEAPGAHNWPYWKKTMPEVMDFHWKVLSAQ